MLVDTVTTASDSLVFPLTSAHFGYPVYAGRCTSPGFWWLERASLFGRRGSVLVRSTADRRGWNRELPSFVFGLLDWICFWDHVDNRSHPCLWYVSLPTVERNSTLVCRRCDVDVLRCVLLSFFFPAFAAFECGDDACFVCSENLCSPRRRGPLRWREPSF